MLRKFKVYLEVTNIYSVEVGVEDKTDVQDIALEEYRMGIKEFEEEVSIDIENINEIEAE